jgi:porin
MNKILAAIFFATGCFTAGLSYAEDASESQSPNSKGADFELVYKGEIQNVLDGGVHQRSVYMENLDLRLGLDMEKLTSWQGASFFFYGLGNRGATDANSGSVNVGDLQVTSNIETPVSRFILYEAWFQQNFFEDKISLLLGLHDLNSEFYSTESSGLFLNSSFGIGKDLSQTGVSGPSIFAITALAARLKLQPTEQYYFQVGVWSAESGKVNYGPDGFLSIAEAGFLIPGDAPSKFALGGWSYDREFEKISDASEKDFSTGYYALADFGINEDLSVFSRVGHAATSTNAVGLGVTAGIQVKKLFSSEREDSLGFGLAQVFLGDDYRAAQLQAGVDTSPSEMTWELTYRIQVTPEVALQPDLQYVVNPSGDKNIPSATVGSLRVEISL